MLSSLAVVVALAVGAAPASAAAPSSDWQEVPSKGPVALKARARAGTGIQEIWAEAEVAAPAADVQEVLQDNEHLSKFMPHVKEARSILKPDKDGGKYLYVLLTLPIIGQRDYVVKTYVDSTLKSDGSGEFKSRWVAAPNAIPMRHSISRIKVNDGSWRVTPAGPGKSKVEYRAFLDPGGVPAASVNSGNRNEIPQTFRALETEARRRAGAHKAGGSEEAKATPPT